MRIKICHSRQGVLFDKEAAKVEAIEQDDRIRFIVTDWDESEKTIITENQYTVLRVGDVEKAQKGCGWLGGGHGMPTTCDIAFRFDEAVETLHAANVDMDKIYFTLPNEEGWLKQYGPVSIYTAKWKCDEYWRDKQ